MKEHPGNLSEKSLLQSAAALFAKISGQNHEIAADLLRARNLLCEAEEVIVPAFVRLHDKALEEKKLLQSLQHDFCCACGQALASVTGDIEKGMAEAKTQEEKALLKKAMDGIDAIKREAVQRESRLREEIATLEKYLPETEGAGVVRTVQAMDLVPQILKNLEGLLARSSQIFDSGKKRLEKPGSAGESGAPTLFMVFTSCLEAILRLEESRTHAVRQESLVSGNVDMF